MSAPLSVTLTDYWGNDWPLGHWTPGPRVQGLRLRSITGLAGAPYGFNEVQGESTAGVIVRGRKDEANTIDIEVAVDDPRCGDDAVAYLMQWRRALGRGLARTEGTPPLRMTIGQSGRWQDVRLMAPKNEPDYRAMHAVGRAIDGITVRQDMTWWRKAPEVRTFTAAQFATATVPNFGDEATWPEYRLVGPITSPTLGLMGDTFPLPSLAAGQWLEIDADPDAWSIVDQAGVDRSWIGTRWSVRAPAGDSAIPVTITGTGTTGATSLTVTVPQYYWAAL